MMKPSLRLVALAGLLLGLLLNSLPAAVLATPTAFDCTTVTDGPALECQALVDLYTSTTGASWTNHTNWLATTTVGNWHGVTVAGGHVTSLILSSNGLSGTIPSSLDNLSNLQFLVLSGNGLNGAIPDTLGNLSNLLYLYLDGNQLSGTIPSSLGNLSNLQFLILAGNQLRGVIPDSLGNLSNLRFLDLSSNPLTSALPQSLTSLSQLGMLNYAATGVCAPSNSAFQTWLSHIPHLTTNAHICGQRVVFAFLPLVSQLRAAH